MALGELVNKGESACPEVGEEGNRMEELGNRSVARELGGGGGGGIKPFMGVYL